MNNNISYIRVYQNTRSDQDTKLNAFSLLMPLWTNLSAAGREGILAGVSKFKQARSGLFHDGARWQEIFLNDLAEVLNACRNAVIQQKKLDSSIPETPILLNALFSIIKNDVSPYNLLKIGKVKATDSLQALSFFVPSATAEVNVDTSFIRGHLLDLERFKQKLLHNLRKEAPKPLLLLTLANRLEIVTDPFEQEELAEAIWNQKFGQDRLILQVLANNIYKLNFDSTLDQDQLINLIYNGYFGSNPLTLKAIAKSLGKITITSIEAQNHLALAIRSGKFGSDERVLSTLAKSMGNLQFSSNLAQRNITQAILFDIFKSNNKTLKNLAQTIGKLNLCSKEAQIDLLLAIFDGKFTRDNLVINALKESLTQINFTQALLQKYLVQLISDGKLNHYQPEEIRNLISRWVIEASCYQEINNIMAENNLLNLEHMQFGPLLRYNYNNDQFPDLTIDTSGLEPQKINISDCFGQTASQAAFGIGSHGLTYDQNNNPELLITYREDITQANNESSITERFLGFFNPEPTNYFLYHHNIENLKVYALHNDNGYPTLLELSESSPLFARFPPWLQKTISYQKFNILDYHSPHIINFVLDFVASTNFSNTELGKKCKDIIIIIIKRQGDTFNLTNNQQTDAKIKDEINQAFNADNEQVFKQYTNYVDLFWNTLSTEDDKLRLIFLLGQIAKKGALGYHYTTRRIDHNTANIAFYKLTTYCVNKLIAERHRPAPEWLEDMAADLRLGYCIEQITHTAITHNPQLRLAWMLNAEHNLQ